MKRADLLLSYLHPVVIESTGSAINPELQVVLNGGRYMLNSKNTNYSYGPLHTLFKKVFRRLELDWNSINKSLILGFGTGCVAETISGYNPNCSIDGVEIDKLIIELGEKYFSTRKLKNLTIYCDSASRFIEKTGKTYDLIVIDVYSDVDVPEEVENEKFLLKISDSLAKGGLVIFNKFVYSQSTYDQVEALKILYEKIFGNLTLMKIMTTGRIFVARK